MIEIMTEREGNIIGLRASGTLSAGDYEQVLLPRLEALARRFETIRALFYMDPGFKGWDLPAAWANTKLDLRFRHNLEKVAIIGAPAWEEWCVKFAAGLLMRGELRTFRKEQLDDAWRWVRS